MLETSNPAPGEPNPAALLMGGVVLGLRDL